ncbi:nucleotide-sugar transporter-domain-containing protein [Spinellus fusiger]|nr:nucleotide-sugar transporter-domain-containing protein [Spinellus fusiger]
MGFQSMCGCLPLKYISLLTLVVQNSALILVMRYTRASVAEDKRYLASTAVVMSETAKTIACIAVLYLAPLPHQRSMRRLCRLLYHELVMNWRECVTLAFPAALYLVQNNLQYVAATHLDAATFQVTYQLKILTTAFFSVILLHRTLSNTKWIALAILTMGIALVVLPKDASLAFWAYVYPQSVETVETSDSEETGNQTNVQGLVAVLLACVLSGLAGVYFEKILKAPAKPTPTEIVSEEDEESKQSMLGATGSENQSPSRGTHRASMSMTEDSFIAAQNQLWIRNIEMSLFSVLFGLVFVVFLQDGTTIAKRGFFVNYTPLTWVVIGIQALGGLVVAVVVKYADNILKGFATSISIILSSIVSVWMFNFSLSFSFVLGAGFVVYATYLYGL